LLFITLLKTGFRLSLPVGHGTGGAWTLARSSLLGASLELLGLSLERQFPLEPIQLRFLEALVTRVCAEVRPYPHGFNALRGS
jgi:hypothetical protein